jgi:hypothetical protein
MLSTRLHGVTSQKTTIDISASKTVMGVLYFIAHPNNEMGIGRLVACLARFLDTKSRGQHNFEVTSKNNCYLTCGRKGARLGRGAFLKQKHVVVMTMTITRFWMLLSFWVSNLFPFYLLL